MAVDLELCFETARSLAQLVASKRLSATELVSNSLERCDQAQRELNCFADLWADEALEAARTADTAVALGRPLGPLHGVPVALKDTTPTAGHRTTLGSATHAGWIPVADASIVESLRRAGSICVGKTTTPEFASWLQTDSPLLGATRNPWDLSRTSGGSSGGSAAAVAAGCVPLAEGSDMGGSVRIPAAWCGVVGFKPSIGRIPMTALPAGFDDLAHHGPLARTVADAQLFVSVTQGADDRDPMSIPADPELSSPLRGSLEGLRFGISADLDLFDVDDAIRNRLAAVCSTLSRLGARIEPIRIGFTPELERAWRVRWQVFMAAFYGPLVEEWRDAMSPVVVDLVEQGSRVSASELKQLDAVRSDAWSKLAAALEGRSGLLCPTMATAPFPARIQDLALKRSRSGRSPTACLTHVFNLMPACPVISVPMGLDPASLPVGLQIVGHRWRDRDLLNAATGIESALDPVPRPPHPDAL